MARTSARRLIGSIAALFVLSAVPAASRPIGSEGPIGDVASPNVKLVANLPTGPGGDLAFWGKRAVVALGSSDGTPSNDGFALVDIRQPSRPREISRFLCPGSASVAGGHDVSIWENLVVVSTQATVNAAACLDGSGLGSGGEMLQPGVMLVDISDPRRPRRIAAVPAGCEYQEGRYNGAHTHTLVPDLGENRLIVYTLISGPGCTSIIEIPVGAPAQAALTGYVDDIDLGLYEGHDEATLCHDLQVFLPKRIGACAASTPGWQLWDLSDLDRPVLMSTIRNRVVEHHHSAAFSSDGNTLVIGEEKASTYGTCMSGTNSPSGALWFYDISDPRNPVQKGYYQNPIPAAAATGWCTAHYFNVVPMTDDRDVLVAGWYGAGTTVIDFTAPSNPRTVAYYLGAARDLQSASNAYASYWYNGAVYVNNWGGDALGTVQQASVETRDRGLDVLAIDDPAVSSAVKLPYLNPGTQTWGG